MGRFRHILFVCQRERAPDNPKGCCARRGAAEVLDRLKALTKEHGLKGKVRATEAGCLDYCKKGVTVAVFSDEGPRPETWYTHVTPEDAEELFTEHVLHGRPLERLIEPSKTR